MAQNKEITADYWDKKISISVPEDAVVPVVPDPPLLKEPATAVRGALENPIGAPPLFELAKKAKGGKVVIGHDDLSRPALPRKIIIPVIMDILNKAGIKDEDVFLVSGNGNHCKWPDAHFRSYFGDEIYNRFRPLGGASRIINHDCHDPTCLTYMGVSELGDYVEYFGLEPGRLNFSWVSASEGAKYAEVITNVVNRIKELGPARRMVKEPVGEVGDALSTAGGATWPTIK